MVPSAPFYFYVGAYPYKPCSGKVNVIIFDSKNAATINSSDMKTIQSLISPISYSKAQKINGAAQNDVIILKNLLGARGPSSDKTDYYILSDCDAVSGMGGGSGDSGGGSDPRPSDDNRKGLPSFLIGLISIMAVLFIIYGVYLICSNFDISMITRNKPNGGPIYKPFTHKI